MAFVLGLGVGVYVGGTLATIYVMLAFRESLDTPDPLRPWFIRYDWAEVAARPALLQSALIITGSVTLALVLVGLAGVHRGRLNQYDDAHFQSKREMKRNGMVSRLDTNGFIFAKVGAPKSESPFVMVPPDRFPHAMMIAPTGRGKGVAASHDDRVPSPPRRPSRSGKLAPAACYPWRAIGALSTCVLRPPEWAGLISETLERREGKFIYHVVKTLRWRSALKLETDGMLQTVSFH